MNTITVALQKAKLVNDRDVRRVRRQLRYEKRMKRRQETIDDLSARFKTILFAKLTSEERSGCILAYEARISDVKARRILNEQEILALQEEARKRNTAERKTNGKAQKEKVQDQRAAAG